MEDQQRIITGSILLQLTRLHTNFYFSEHTM